MRPANTLSKAGTLEQSLLIRWSEMQRETDGFHTHFVTKVFSDVRLVEDNDGCRI